MACIVNKESPIKSATKTELKELFLGKVRKLGGSDILLPFDVAASSPVRKEFLDMVEKSESELKQYWSRQVFKGLGSPPTDVGDDKKIKLKVVENKSGIGCVVASEADDTVKVIFKN